MELRRNIIFSLVFHITIITVAFLFIGRDKSFHVSANLMTVSLLKEMTGITSTPLHDIKDNKKHSSPIPREKEARRQVQDFSKDENKTKSDSRVLVGIKKEEIVSVSSQNDNNSVSVDSIIIKTGLDDDVRTAAGAIRGLPQLYDHKGSTDQQGKGSGEIISSQNAGSSNTKNPQKSDTSYLYALIRTAIEKATTYPFLARKNGLEGTVMTGFTINSKGYPENIKVEKSSGYEILDSAAIKIVMRAAPLPKVKDKIVISIIFKLTDSSSTNLSSR